MAKKKVEEVQPQNNVSDKILETLKQINTSLKTKDTATLGVKYKDFQKIPFSSISMNWLTRGGLPLGKIVEFYGSEGSSKTTNALDIIANAQKLFKKEAEEFGTAPRAIIYVDAENSLDEKWMKRLGVDVDSLIVMQPEGQYAEEIFQSINEIIDKGEVGLVVLDSLPSLLSKKAMEESIEKQTYAGISSALTTFSAKLSQQCPANRTLFIGINQLRDNIGNMFVSTKTPGGRAWKHFCSVRMEFRKGKLLDEVGNEIKASSETAFGNIIEVAYIKNKINMNDRRMAKASLNYMTGIDIYNDLCFMAEVCGMITKSGAWYKIVDKETGEIIADKIQGRASILNFLKENKDVYDKVYSYVEKEMVYEENN